MMMKCLLLSVVAATVTDNAPVTTPIKDSQPAMKNGTVANLKEKTLAGEDKCSVNADCDGHEEGWYSCDTETKTCKHKALFPMKQIEIWGTIVLTITIALCIISGIGGGGVVLPLLMIFFNLPTKTAVAVSGVKTLLGGIVRYHTILNERHPEKDATSLDYSMSVLMLPTVLVGSITGVFLNKILPELILNILLTLLLGGLTFMASTKAKSIYKKESDEIKAIETTLAQISPNWQELTPIEQRSLVVQEKEKQRQVKIEQQKAIALKKE